jgi:hypothetical protein
LDIANNTSYLPIQPILEPPFLGSKKACLFILALKWRLWKMTVDGSGLADEVR